jgi:PKD repeat protein
MEPRRPFPRGPAYQEALQHPRRCFLVPDLQQGTVLTDSLGLPKPIAGNFGAVFRIRMPSGEDWAIKCFTSRASNQERRYEAIGRSLGRVKAPWMTSFRYLPAAIVISDQKYPILRMEWLNASNLVRYLDSHYESADEMNRIAAQFVKILTDLTDHGIGHGDLQHRNLLVDSRAILRLVDFDGMFVPDLIEIGAPDEFGHPNYQPPSRDSTDWGPKVDRFSAWVIYGSLRALSLEPRLWHAMRSAGDERLLFGRMDYADPDSSTSLEILRASNDTRVRAIAAALDWLFRNPRSGPLLHRSTVEGKDIQQWPFSILTGPSTSIAPLRPPPLLAAFTVTHQGLTVTVDARPTIGLEPDNQLTWEWGDGEIAHTQSPMVRHTYCALDDYEIRLIVETHDSRRSFERKVVRLRPEASRPSPTPPRPTLPAPAVDAPSPPTRTPSSSPPPQPTPPPPRPKPPPPVQLPSPAFTASSKGLVLKVDASRTTSDPRSTSPLVYEWDWGDNVRETVSWPKHSHRYDRPDTYWVTLVARNSAGPRGVVQRVSITQPSTIVNLSPSTSKLTATVSATVSGSPAVLTYDWGDGTTIDLHNSSHTYDRPCTRRVTVTATNTEGSDTKSVPVSVNQTPVISYFTIDRDELTVTVGRVDIAANSYATFTYDWGDGWPASDIPVHTYRSAGDYYLITVTATNSEGSYPLSKPVAVSLKPMLKRVRFHPDGDLTVVAHPPEFQADPSLILKPTYMCEWGDGRKSEELCHTYKEPGTYPVTVTARNVAGWSTYETTVSVRRAQPETDARPAADSPADAKVDPGVTTSPSGGSSTSGAASSSGHVPPGARSSGRPPPSAGARSRGADATGPPRATPRPPRPPASPPMRHSPPRSPRTWGFIWVVVATLALLAAGLVRAGDYFYHYSDPKPGDPGIVITHDKGLRPTATSAADPSGNGVGVLRSEGSIRLDAKTAAVTVGTIREGQKVNTFADGFIGYGNEGAPDCTGRPVVDADGNRMLNGVPCGTKLDPSMPLPTAPVGALLVGMDPEGPWQLLGSQGFFVAPKDGTLYFAYNDANRSDDTGYFTIRYQVTG